MLSMIDHFLYLFYDIVGLYGTYASLLTEKFSGSCQTSGKSGIPPKGFPDRKECEEGSNFGVAYFADKVTTPYRFVWHLLGLGPTVSAVQLPLCNLGCFCKVSILGEWNL